MATPTRTLTGTVTKCEMRQFDNPDPYATRYSGGESYHLKLMVALQTDEGEEVWFWSPPAVFRISGGGGFYVHYVMGNDWIANSEHEIGNGGKSGGSYGVPLVQVGDTLTVKGRFKKTTRFGDQLFYVKRIAA